MKAADIRALAEAALRDAKAATPELAADESPDDTVWECPGCHEYCGREADEETPEDRLCSGCAFKALDRARTREPELARFALAVLDALDERGITVASLRAAIARHLERK